MEAIHNELVQLRNGVEILVSSWDVANLVTKVEGIVAIDEIKKTESRRWKQPAKHEVVGSGAVNVELCLMTFGKLNEANKAALNQYGNSRNCLYPMPFAKQVTLSPTLMKHFAFS